MRTTARERRVGYPLWIGLLAVAAAAVWWVRQPPPAPAPVAPRAPASAAAAATVPADAGPPVIPPSLRWRVEGRPALPDAESLQGCLRGFAQEGAVVSRDGAGLAVHAAGVSLRVAPVAGALEVATPGAADRRALLGLHLAAAGCLRADGATLVDPELDRRFTGADWPAPSARGGIPVEAVVDLAPVAGGVVSRGLARLELPEVALVAGPDAAADRRLLQRAVSALVVHGLPADRLLSLGGDERADLRAVADLGDAPWLPAGLAGTDGMLLLAPGVSPPAPLRATPERPRRAPAAAPRPTPDSPERRPQRPRPALPAFRPDYR